VSRWMTYRIKAFWLVPPSSLALLTSVGWWLNLRPAAAEWGTVSSWVATGGGLIALAFAGSQLRLVLLQRRQAMGDSLAVIVEKPDARSSRLKVDLVNAGQFGVHSVQVTLAGLDHGTWIDRSSADGPPGGVVVPATSATLSFDAGTESRSASEIGVRVVFADVDGHLWSSIHTLGGQKLKA
jgi:hypothetical protein